MTIATQGQGYGAVQGGFAQKPDFSNYTSGGYGSHAANAAHAGASYKGQPPRLRKPKLRGTMSLGFEKSNSGALLPGSGFNGAIYDPMNPLWLEGHNDGTTTTTYFGEDPVLDAKDISFDDVYSTPFRLAAGAEYIISPTTTVFGNAGYTYAEGEQSGVSVIGDLTQRTTDNASGLSQDLEFPNVEVSKYTLDFSDMKRFDLEVGARHYFNPVIKDQGYRTVTPFVGVSGGLAHYDAVDVKLTQDHLFMEQAFNSGLADLEYYEVDVPATTTRLYDSQWVPTGSLTAGFEWQATPKTAIALETGLRYEGGREFASGENGDDNISIPLTLRGSVNF